MNIDPSNQTKLYGHEDQMNSLLKLYKKNYLPNKILFSGEKGVGKSTLAYHLINFILSNDEDGVYDLKNFQINLENKSFRLIQNNLNPNFILADVNQEKKKIDIGQIRNLILTLNKSLALIGLFLPLISVISPKGTQLSIISPIALDIPGSVILLIEAFIIVSATKPGG